MRQLARLLDVGFWRSLLRDKETARTKACVQRSAMRSSESLRANMIAWVTSSIALTLTWGS